jgi:hypothetical protein
MGNRYQIGEHNRSSVILSILPIGHGLFYLATGVWPILNRRSFELVTGPKTDFWLVRTIGGLISVVGAVILMSGLRRSQSPEVSLLALGSAASLTTSDLVYTAKKVIHPIYLLDALAEVVLMFFWALRIVSRR